MTDEQKRRIRQAGENDCEFDGMPVHPHYCYYLTCAGFSNISEIENMTEKEFFEFLNNAKNRAGNPISHMKNVGATVARNIKKIGVVFKEECE
jgi:hypothetical protein